MRGSAVRGLGVNTKGNALVKFTCKINIFDPYIVSVQFLFKKPVQFFYSVDMKKIKGPCTIRRVVSVWVVSKAHVPESKKNGKSKGHRAKIFCDLYKATP